jgi:hypothetical protein
LNLRLTVHAHKFSKSAQEKIRPGARYKWSVAGGKVEVSFCSNVAAVENCWPTSFVFPTCASAFCLRWACWRSTAWAVTFRRRASTPISCSSFSNQNRGSFLGFVDLFSGGQLRRLTIFALGIMPYITASIILQLLTVVYEPLAKLQKEGELGRKKITQWTRYITVILSAVQSFGIAIGLQRQRRLRLQPGRGFILMTMLTLTTGSAFIMWLGEQITERGVGNGMSLLIFAGIVVGLPRGVYGPGSKR